MRYSLPDVERHLSKLLAMVQEENKKAPSEFKCGRIEGLKNALGSVQAFIRADPSSGHDEWIQN